jgi:hypothetical protein
MATLFKGPYVNLNGASRESLIQQHADVAGAAEALIQALGRAAPHGRDYQTVGTDAYKHDRTIWEAYIETTRLIFDEYRGVVERLYMDRPRGK